MGEVIDIRPNSGECFSYQAQDKFMSVGLDAHDLTVHSNGSVTQLTLNGSSIDLDRMQLASFLYAAATMLDSEERTRDGEYPALNYKDIRPDI
tara:strand:- start:200 stop:478 length:279 start_codon:yes stop_codon:yes gene_type:complete